MATLVLMPRLSPTMEEGVLAKWSKKAGDKIQPGDVIAEVETDKANMDFPLEEEGVLLKLLVAEGATVKLGDPVAVLGVAGENDAAIAAAVAGAAHAAAAPAAAASAPAAPAAASTSIATANVTAPASAPAVAGNGRVKASPLARKIAEERGVDVGALSGSGPGGRVVKRDVVSAEPASARAPQPTFTPGVDEVTAASPMRKTIARRLQEAKRDIPHIYLVADATVDRLLTMRAEMNAAAPEGVKISVNDLVVKALALALRRVPEANASYDDKAATLTRHGRVDVGVAVSLPDGLLTPVVRHADQKSVSAVSAEIRELAERARRKKLRPEEYTGGTATVTNLGMFGVREFSAIINPPESVILAVGASEKRAVVVEVGGHDEVRVVQRMTLTLSCDHRIVDGVLGARLLAEVVRLLENPIALVM